MKREGKGLDRGQKEERREEKWKEKKKNEVKDGKQLTFKRRERSKKGERKERI